MTERLRALRHEESPNTIGTGCRLITGGGDTKESATEINRPVSGKDGKAGQEPTAPTATTEAM